MWDNFFKGGGWGMYPTLIFGFSLFATVGLGVLRRRPLDQGNARLLGALTLCSGLLGTTVGICRSAAWLGNLPHEQQLPIFARGCEESLHNLVLALMVVILCGLVALAGSLRRRPEAASAT